MTTTIRKLPRMSKDDASEFFLNLIKNKAHHAALHRHFDVSERDSYKLFATVWPLDESTIQVGMHIKTHSCKSSINKNDELEFLSTDPLHVTLTLSSRHENDITGFFPVEALPKEISKPPLYTVGDLLGENKKAEKVTNLSNVLEAILPFTNYSESAFSDDAKVGDPLLIISEFSPKETSESTRDYSRLFLLKFSNKPVMVILSEGYHNTLTGFVLSKNVFSSLIKHIENVYIREPQPELYSSDDDLYSFLGGTEILKNILLDRI